MRAGMVCAQGLRASSAVVDCTLHSALCRVQGSLSGCETMSLSCVFAWASSLGAPANTTMASRPQRGGDAYVLQAMPRMVAYALGLRTPPGQNIVGAVRRTL